MTMHAVLSGACFFILSWIPQDVTYYVQTKAGREKTTILEGLQGFFEPGKITAVVSLQCACISPP